MQQKIREIAKRTAETIENKLAKLCRLALMGCDEAQPWKIVLLIRPYFAESVPDRLLKSYVGRLRPIQWQVEVIEAPELVPIGAVALLAVKNPREKTPKYQEVRIVPLKGSLESHLPSDGNLRLALLDVSVFVSEKVINLCNTYLS